MDTLYYADDFVFSQAYRIDLPYPQITRPSQHLQQESWTVDLTYALKCPAERPKIRHYRKNSKGLFGFGTGPLGIPTAVPSVCGASNQLNDVGAYKVQEPLQRRMTSATKVEHLSGGAELKALGRKRKNMEIQCSISVLRFSFPTPVAQFLVADFREHLIVGTRHFDLRPLPILVILRVTATDRTTLSTQISNCLDSIISLFYTF